MARADSFEEIASLAASIAREAGSLLRERLGHPGAIRYKAERDPVTEVDRLSEALIQSRIRSRHPDHSILSEEGAEGAPEGPYLWIVDPLDGTVNYAHGYPTFAVSIAVEKRGRGVVVGVVHDPMRDETFVAVKGKGATRNGSTLHVSAEASLANAVLATGFPYDLPAHPQPVLAIFTDFALSAQGVRRDGCASLDLCAVAAGRLDGYWEAKLHAWDVAAGSLIVEEADGRVSDYEGRPLDIRGQSLLATNGKIHGEMLAHLAKTNT